MFDALKRMFMACSRWLASSIRIMNPCGFLRDGLLSGRLAGEPHRPAGCNFPVGGLWCCAEIAATTSQG